MFLFVCINCETANECGEDSVAQTCAIKKSVCINLHSCNEEVDLSTTHSRFNKRKYT